MGNCGATFKPKGGNVVARETRKCGTCGNPIIVNRQNLDNIAFYQGYYHHVGCLVDKANKGVESGKRVANWVRLLNRIPELKAESKRKLEYTMVQDEFNDYLLQHYDVIAVSNRFWNIVNELGNGIYKRQKCKPIDIDTIMGTWKWGQHHLDKIAASNKTNNRGPSNDDQRLNYDLAIVIKHVGDYKKHITSTKEEAAIVTERIEKQNKINYEELYKQSESKSQREDILDLMDEIF